MTISLSSRADLWGERTAVIETSEGRSYSYAALDALAERFARKLAGRGVGRGDRVALLSRNRIELLACVFAARRLGVALALLSPRLSKSTMADRVSRLDPRIVLHEAAQSDRLRKVRETTAFEELTETDPGEYEPAESMTEPWLSFHPGDGERPVYTFSEAAVEWNCLSETTSLGLGRPRAANLAPLFRTDGLLVGTLPTLYTGGSVLLHRAFRPDPALSLIERHDATHVYGTPLEFDRLTGAEGFATANFASVEAFYSSAPLPPELHDAYLVQNRPVGRLFGTPAAPHIFAFPPERGDVVEKADSVGRPLLDCEVRIADGRLEVRGPAVAEGTLDGEFDGWIETDLRARRDGEGDYWIERE